jgi:hypothetical protein
MGRACSSHGRYSKFIRVLVDKYEGKKPLVIPREDGSVSLTDINQTAVGWEGEDWTQLARNRVHWPSSIHSAS